MSFRTVIHRNIGWSEAAEGLGADGDGHRSGSVCLDVINQTWSPMFDMINIFEVFLPQLLRYPNPTDPLNGEAAAMLMREPKNYEAKVKGT